MAETDDSRINVLTLGAGGVDVDTDPILTADNATLRSQNANYDPTSARGGALAKRRGLDRFHTIALAGPILGGIDAPYQGTGGAPASGGGGGGAPGDPGGTGNPNGGTGSGPGDPIAGGPGTTPSVPNGGPVFAPNVGAPIFGGKHLVAIGRWTLADLGTLSSSWYLSDSGFADLAMLVTPTSAPNAGEPSAEGPNASFPTTVGGMSIGQKYTVANGALYYQQHIANQTPATNPVLPAIRKITADGKIDSQIFTLPDNPVILNTFSSGTIVVTHESSVTAIVTEWGNGDAIWIAVYDKITNGSIPGNYGRVLRVTGLDVGAYVVTEVYNALNTNNVAGLNNTPCVPYCLENFLGNMWMGMWTGVTNGSPLFVMFQPNPASPDGYRFVKSNALVGGSVANVTCMKAFNGNLYVGYTNLDPTVQHGSIYQYTPTGAVSVALVGSGGTAVSELGFVSMEIFNGQLYASYFNPTQASKIYQTADGVTWNAVYAASTSGQKAIPLVLRADGGVLYAWGANSSNNNTSFLESPDGTTWNDKTANFPGTSTFPVNLLFGFDQ